jgi:pimeloyl-ACP methyl ester carboxylesterase
MRAIALLLLAGSLVAHPLRAAAQTPFDHACVAQNGVRFCPTQTLADRIPTWDGVPLDVDVTLPPTGSPPFPTIFMLHGLGGSKLDFEATTPEGTGCTASAPASCFHYNNIFYAQRGYMVVNYSARGWGNSCGLAPSRITPDCATGWIRLADQRWEVRDAQHLMGMLVDQGLADPAALGATGVSYGGGTSLQLAALRNKIRNTAGRRASWRSPQGRPLRLAAAWPRWPWSDLAESLIPNGRYRDDRIKTIALTGKPLGVEKSSFATGLLLTAQFFGGFLAEPNEDPIADLCTWKMVLDEGEPYGTEVRAVENELDTFHSPIPLLRRRRPAPLLMLSGFTDDLFPAAHSLRVYMLLKGRKNAPVSLQLGDIGHMRAQNKLDEYQYFNTQGAQFFDAYLRKIGSPPAPRSVSVFTQTCPISAPAGGPFLAARWEDLATGTFEFGSDAPQTVTSTGGNPTLAMETDPIYGNGICAQFPAADLPGTAVYTAPSPGFLLMGAPTLTARIRTDGPFGQLVGRLWDVDPQGRQSLIARGVYRLRPNQRGRIVFQLEGNAYEFAAGHTVRLELLGNTEFPPGCQLPARPCPRPTQPPLPCAPTYRPSNGTFTVMVRDASISLPTHTGSP